MFNKQQRQLHFLILAACLLGSFGSGQIRLVGSGSTGCSGTVEVQYNGTWGTVCDDNWDLNDAKVVCRQLSCGPALLAVESARFGQGSGPIWMDEVACSGSESSLTNCSHIGYGAHNCNHDEDAGVICSERIVKPNISMVPAGEVFWGQELRITCSAVAEPSTKTFILQKTPGSFRQTLSTSSRTGTFTVSKVNFDYDGLYQCQYKKTVDGETFTSPLSDPLNITVSVKFSKPILTVSSAVVSWGQEIWFVCSVQPQILGGTFILMNDKRSYRKTPPSGSKSTNFIIYKADIDHEGSYQCRFQKRGTHQNFSSPVSNSVRVSVTVRLQIPKISLSSPGRGLGSKKILITRGDNFTFTCSINSQYPQGLFFLVFSGSNMTSNISAVNNAASFTFPAAELEHQGSYSCVYQITLAGRTFTSAESAPISIGVQLSLQIPNISITFPGAELVRGPGVVDVTRGHSFTITCSVNSKSLQNQFYLIFSGSNMTNSNSSVNNSASFTFPVADFEHQGNYSCVYQVTQSGRTFTSAESAPITVAVKQSLLLQTYAVFGGILLLLLFVLFLVCLIYRKRKLPAVLFQRFTRENDGNCEIKYENSSEENLL